MTRKNGFPLPDQVEDKLRGNDRKNKFTNPPVNRFLAQVSPLEY